MKDKDLTPLQITYAEWLATPPLERSPAEQKELAAILEVTPRTLMLWKKLPQLLKLVNELYADRLITLVGPATELLEKAIKKPDSVSRVSYDAARYIVQDWGRKYQAGEGIEKTIADMYKKYNP